MWDEPTAQETLRRLEARLEQASGAAERLIAEAAESISGRGARDAPLIDEDLLHQLTDRLREVISPELQRSLAEALRELLLALKALVEWCLERLERRRTAPVEVRDIPID